MTSIDELLCVPDSSGTTEINVRDIYPFENHPFKVLEDEKMEELIDSIKVCGTQRCSSKGYNKGKIVRVS